jgi:hypothetical protein
MNLVYLSLLLFPFSLFGFGMPLLPIKQVEAEQIIYTDTLVTLIGHVSVSHDIGIVRCNKALLYLSDGKQNENDLSIQKIELFDEVKIDFTDGSSLSSQEGEINCQSMESIFTASPPEKVIYTSYAHDEKNSVPVRASGRNLKAKIVKTPQGYSLTSLKCDGAVHIEYLTPEEQPKPQSMERPHE